MLDITLVLELLSGFPILSLISAKNKYSSTHCKMEENVIFRVGKLQKDLIGLNLNNEFYSNIELDFSSL